MSQIMKLTKDQENQLSVYCDRYCKLGYSTKKISKNETESIIKNFYQLIEKEAPNEILIFPSPEAAWKHIQEAIGQKMDFIWPYPVGSWDAHIFAFYDYFIETLKIKIDKALLEKYENWKKTMQLGLIFVIDDVCIVCEKPVKYHFKDKVLHNESGPAVVFADGSSYWFLNGVHMTQEYVETPWNKLDVKTVVKETNAEVRRELVRKIGMERIVTEMGATTLDTQGDYELLELDIGDNTRRPYLKMLNPSIGVWHVEGVPPNTKTVAEALKFRNGTDEVPEMLS